MSKHVYIVISTFNETWIIQIFTQELVDFVKKQRMEIGRKDRRIRELEDYIDQLVLRVLNTQPALLQAPFDRAVFYRL